MESTSRDNLTPAVPPGRGRQVTYMGWVCVGVHGQGLFAGELLSRALGEQCGDGNGVVCIQY